MSNLVYITLEAQGENRESLIEALENAIRAIKLGENEAGGYRQADYSFVVTGEE